VDALTVTLSAVADPTRRSILDRLKRGPATVGELAEPFRISQQAISKHLAYLERARLIEKRREGRQHICELNSGPLAEVAQWTEQFRRFWEESYERLDSFLVELKAKDEPKSRRDPPARKAKEAPRVRKD
jgi:DNA-binding transcriptional ArsR family regulator